MGAWRAALCASRTLLCTACDPSPTHPPATQFEQERSRALSKELLAARERWRATEDERSASEDARRVEEAAAKARAELERRKEEQRRYQEVRCRGAAV